MKKISLVSALVLVFGVVSVSLGAEFQGHKWGANVKETSEILANRYLNHTGTMGPPRTDTQSKQITI